MEFNTEIPIYMQVIRDIKKQIVQKKFLPGDKLPSSRELAILYKVNPNTAARIYRELESEGYCYTKRGLGTFITEDESVQKKLRKEMAQSLLDGFLKEMNDLGFERKEIIYQIQNFKEEEEV